MRRSFLELYPDYLVWKEKVFEHYGRQCQCCGTYENPSIDHIAGNGKEHRKEMKGLFYQWLVENDFPEGFQTLCRSCNSSKGRGDHCMLHEDSEHGRYRLARKAHYEATADWTCEVCGLQRRWGEIPWTGSKRMIKVRRDYNTGMLICETCRVPLEPLDIPISA